VARNSLWYLVRSDTEEARQARRRLVVGSAFAVFLGGLLTAAGLAIVVLGVCLLIVAVVGGTAGLRALRRHWDGLQRSAYSILTVATRAFMHNARRTATALHAFAQHVVQVVIPRATHVGSRGVHRVSQTATTRWQRYAAPRTRPIDLQREALRLNAAGTKQRRSGAPAEAIQLHQRALDLLSQTHDPRAVALTQNNLALALSHAGDDRSATTLFERAAATARELGDDEHEGRIMANLALAHRRHGRSHECEEALRLALTKLRRDSSAYRRVEAELSRVA
jgi:tetratricopeptide (TPR) repeat protein